jgi:SagB-type dehydrogenase family enzyme
VGRLLHLLHQKEINGEKKYLYPSAGGLNAVQTYLYAHKGRIESIPHGIYYYHPVEHALYRITGDPDISPAIHFPSNRDSFDAAAFSVYFIAQLDAIEPVYTVMSRELVTLDAGYMTQLLQSRQEDMGVRLCPVSGVDFESIRHFFRLSPAHMFVQCLLGGPADSSARRAQAEDIEAYIKTTGRKIHAHFREADGDRTYLDTDRIVQFERLNALSEEEHVLLHRRRLHLRTFTNGAVGLKLPRGRIDDAEYILRSTKRSYENRTVPFASFSRFMKLLGQESIDGKARRLYPSISATYAVHVYAYVKENGVENVASGIYRYDPVEHSLQAVTVRPACDIKAAHFPGNRSYYNQSKFSLFLIADLEKLRPSFGEEALHLVTLEAGCIGQLLLDRQAEFDMGVCSIGGMRFDKVRDDFKLSRGQMLVHSFVCGPVSRLLTVPAHRKLMPPAAPLKHGMLSHWLRGLRL